MSKLNTWEYVPPGYLTKDDVLDCIGKVNCEEWDSGYIEKARISHPRITTDASGSKARVQYTYIELLCPADLEKARHALDNSKPQQKSPPPSFAVWASSSWSQMKPKTNELAQELSSTSHDKEKDKALVLNENKPPRNPKPMKNFGTHRFHIRPTSLIGDFITVGREEPKEFNLKSEEDRVELTNILNLTNALNLFRDILVQAKLRSYLKEDGEYKEIPSTVWNGNETDWSLFLLEGRIRNKNKKLIGNIFFLEKDVEEFLLQDKKMDSSCDLIIVEQLLAGVKDGTIKFRGTERLYLRAKIQSHDKNNQIKPIKGSDTLSGIIENLAKDMGLTTIKRIRKSFPDLKTKTPDQLDQIDQTHVTKKEKEDIAKFIRPLYKQRS